MWNFSNLKRNRYKLRGNYLLKLPDTNTCRYGTKALCFKGSLLCGIRFQTNLKIWILSKNLRTKPNNGMLVTEVLKFVNRKNKYVYVISNKPTLTTEKYNTVLHNLFLVKRMSMFNKSVLKNDLVTKSNTSICFYGKGFSCLTAQVKVLEDRTFHQKVLGKLYLSSNGRSNV